MNLASLGRRSQPSENRSDAYPACPHGPDRLPRGNQFAARRFHKNGEGRNDLQFRDLSNRAMTPAWHVPKTAPVPPRAAAVLAPKALAAAGLRYAVKGPQLQQFCVCQSRCRRNRNAAEFRMTPGRNCLGAAVSH
jgi:hypothetical protein